MNRLGTRGTTLAVAAAVAALTAACSTAVAQSQASVARPVPAQALHPSATSPAPSARPAAAVVRGYVVTSGESFPAAKREASHVASALTTYGATDRPAVIAARVTADPARQRALMTSAQPLWHVGAASVGSVVYPQMGGTAGTRVSVIVDLRQTVTPASGRPYVQTRSLDIRLVRIGGSWTFDALASAGGVPVARPASLPAAATAVLDDPRIVLTDSARWDIYRGAISPVLLRLMEQVAARTPYAVTVLETGHPFDVFGTAHESLHSAGRAMDINLLGHRHVVDQRQPGSPAYDLVRWLLAQPEVSQVGSPWVLGPQPRSFTNTVHLDHIHVST